jgi:hypothetical protein
MLYDNKASGESFELARYLINYDTALQPTMEQQWVESDPNKLNNIQIQAEIRELVHELKDQQAPALRVFQHYRNAKHTFSDLEEHHAEMLEECHVYDKYLLAVLKEFCVITIAFLTKLEKMHKKGILCGNISPYNFMYNRITKQCAPVDLSVVLSDKNLIHAEPQKHGDLIYVITDLGMIPENKYLAPELKESVHVFNQFRRLKNLLYIAESRNLLIPNIHEIKKLLLHYHQKKIKYSNKAEIYSVGYSINQILSHMLEKLARFKLFLHEPINTAIPQAYIDESEALLPHEFANPYQERIPELVNEAISYVYDLMQEHVEQRDSLPESIEKFKSLLKRISMTKPDSILEREENEEEELADKILAEEIEFEEYEEEGEEDHEEHMHTGHAHDIHEEHVHASHVHDHTHDHEEHEHEHDAHEHGAHEHSAHEHDHAAHEHGDHEHTEHEHTEHEHTEHEHTEHDEHHHEHDAHEHIHAHGTHVHDHDEHEHGHDDHEHGHDEHEHGHDEHEHGHDEHEHGHDEHGHDAHEHSHDAHEHGHDEYGHDAHEHAHTEHEAHAHAEHHQHPHDSHEHGKHEHTAHEDDHKRHASDEHTISHGSSDSHRHLKRAKPESHGSDPYRRH